MACNANTVCFDHMLRMLRHHHQDKDLSKLTLVDICGTDNPSIIDAIPREEFIARVNAKKQDIDLPVNARTDPEVAERRAEQEARTPTFKHDECSIAFPEKNFERNFSVHVSGHRLGPTPTPVKHASHYCREKKACEDCQKWVRKVAEGTVSLETSGAGWTPSRDLVLGVAARVRAALPGITFGGVELPMPGRYTSGRKSKAAKSKAPEPAPPPRSKRARRGPKKMED